MSAYSDRHPLRDCANVTAGASNREADSTLVDKPDGSLPSVSPVDSRQAVREMQQACTAMVQREAENNMMLMEDTVRVRVSSCVLAHRLLRSPAVLSSMHP